MKITKSFLLQVFNVKSGSTFLRVWSIHEMQITMVVTCMAAFFHYQIYIFHILDLNVICVLNASQASYFSVMT